MAKNRQTHNVRRATTSQSAAAARAYYDSSLALVIGIDEYGGSNDLKNAVNDATAVAEVLQATHGFEVETLYNEEATRDVLWDLLHDDLPNWVGTDDRLLIFFAGHGVTREIRPGYSRGFLVPHGASDRYATYVDMFTVRDACSWIPAKHILIVLDCCFSGILGVTTDQRSEPVSLVNDVYLERMTTAPAWQVLTAGRADELAADSSERPGHSAFTSALLDGLEGRADQDGDRIITARSLADYVEPRVVRETTARGGFGQTPYFSYLTGSGAGNVVFVLPPEEEEEPAVDEPSVVLTSRASDAVGAHRELSTREESTQSPIDFDWVTIPAGEFTMGSDKKVDSEARDSELPQHKVHMPTYRIARVPVTNVQYKRFVDETGYEAPKHWNGKNIPDGKQDHPVVNVSWGDAMAFCKWAGVRLPSEAEWEKAARGTDGRAWPWGNEPPTNRLCNFNMNVGDTTPVSNYPKGASPYGCLDMAGNVSEWMSSLWKGYPYDVTDGREDLAASGPRVVRGGAFYIGRGGVRCAYRGRGYPSSRVDRGSYRVCAPGL